MTRTRFWLATALVFVAGTAAYAQSATALTGMQAYNRGDVAGAYLLLREAANANDPEALVNLGYFYARGQVVREDQKEALRLYLKSAELGDSEGMNAVGYKYLHGTGVAVDAERAVHWFCLAIAQGNPRAMNNLAIMLSDGLYLMHDEIEARSLWEQSAKLGHANSMMNLGRSYFTGMDPDPEKGSMWINRAAQAGNPEAQSLLRANGYSGPLPMPFYEANVMIPAPKNKAGHTKICGALIS